MIGLAAWAMAQTPPAEPPEPSDEDLEIIVYGELLVEQARSAVVQELEEAGYDHRVIDLGDRVVYRHSLSYHGEVVVHDDGYVQVRRQPLHAVGRQMPWARENTPLAWAGCLLWPWACVRVYGFTVSDRRWRSRETKTVQRIEPKVREWGNRIADLSTSQKVDSMSGLLEQLWVRGKSLEGEELVSYRERRAWLLAYYGSRTETEWGRKVRASLAAFMRAVVQTSDHPFTPAELARFEEDYGFALPVRPK